MQVKNQRFWHPIPFCTAFLILCISVLNVHVGTGWTKDDGVKEDAKPAEKKGAEPESKKSISGSTLLYSGIGVAAVAAVAAVAGAGGSSSDSDEATPPAATTTTTTTTTKTTTTPASKPKITTPKDNNPAGSDPVGADIGGNDWSGLIDLVGFQGENITASISQNGNYVVITTSSHQKYGQKLVGNITSAGFMKLYDQRTGEDWTTHYGNATSNKIELYDFVDNNFRDFDKIILQR